ncbi:MAG: GGDEF domain-containing protein [Alphaproteobacteria bacterium]
MTTDMVQNTMIAKAQHAAVPAPQTKDPSFFGYRDLFSFLRKDSHHTTDPKTRELLKTAYTMLEQAEKEISLKDERISRLEDILTVDELTQLTNRRGFYKAFKAELDRTNRGENKGGLLIMIDLDHFKAVNDTFGHQAGDEALKIVGQFLQRYTRDMDVAARLGGDEFIALMPNTSIAKAMKRAQQLGEELNDLSFEWNGSYINIRASLGLKEYKAGETIETIIEEADQGMYANKEIRKQTRH